MDIVRNVQSHITITLDIQKWHETSYIIKKKNSVFHSKADHQINCGIKSCVAFYRSNNTINISWFVSEGLTAPLLDVQLVTTLKFVNRIGIILGQEDKVPVRPVFAGLFCSLPTKAFVTGKRSQTSLLK